MRTAVRVANARLHASGRVGSALPLSRAGYCEFAKNCRASTVVEGRHAPC